MMTTSERARMLGLRVVRNADRFTNTPVAAWAAPRRSTAVEIDFSDCPLADPARIRAAHEAVMGRAPGPSSRKRRAGGEQ